MLVRIPFVNRVINSNVRHMIRLRYFSKKQTPFNALFLPGVYVRCSDEQYENVRRAHIRNLPSNEFRSIQFSAATLIFDLYVRTMITI